MMFDNLLVRWLLTCVVAWLLWRYMRQRFVKSPLDNIPGPPAQSFWMGNLHQFLHRHGSEFHQEISKKYGPVVKFYGPFGLPMLYIYDPKALHNILIKEQNIYQEGDAFVQTNLLIHGPGVICTQGDQHRRQRRMLNPVFSINHMRHMLPTFYKTAHRLREAFVIQVRDGPKHIDILGWMGRTALELIGQGGLGYSFDSLVEDMKDPFAEALKSLAPTLQSLFLLFPLLPYVSWIGSPSFQRRVIDMFPHKGVQKLKSIIDIMDQKSVSIFEAKKLALQQGDEAVLRQVGEGKDIMSILMKANMVASEGDRLPENELIAQMTTLIFGAMDTTSSAMSRALYLLAQHPEVQEKVRKEILEAHAGESLAYDELNQLPYLDAVCRETLRLYPPITLLSREPKKDMVLPLSEPVRGLDGQLMHEIFVPKGTQVWIGIQGSNVNGALWGKDALHWKPERWLAPLPKAVNDAHIPGVYANLLTFLGGGKSCIGFKFSEMEIKVILSVLLSTFTFELTEKPIVWNVAGIWYPTVGKESNEPQMPLKVAMLKVTG
ncbi:hypothetical protein AcV7_004962 [Taiwanofungus camphoratus]|nr:hypothetical protein AcV7_004962 [Antrodia cinnamomea]